MKKQAIIIVSIVIIISAVAAFAQDTKSKGLQMHISDHLKPFLPYVGKVWLGDLDDGQGNKLVDEAEWFVILSGHGIRHVHKLSNGYSGETIYYYDKSLDKVVYYYFTNAGFYTKGQVDFVNGNIVTLEKVSGNSNVTEVKGELLVQDDGSFIVNSSYKKDGEWVQGHKSVYKAKE